jgi:hypothetical protein
MKGNPLSPLVLGLTAMTLGFALAWHGALRLAEALERRGAILSRDLVMAPALVVLAIAMGLIIEPLGRAFSIYPGDLVLAALFGLKIGSLVPRPERGSLSIR